MSPEKTSWTFSFQVPFAATDDALTVYVVWTLGAESLIEEFFSR